ncbi:hypothetical protein [Saccharothrix texasensis]|uniref:Uncharacterized protein n=1 Tax=Saccharothrix texasensis TaxID=103734 RepID=A0A3N1H1J7_9PSEU|nr:hypothetical protein [Saccharothrix texasensis]ROP36374.1 hypothetical protein EDD40_1641 [Saccharothrix texasensis]
MARHGGGSSSSGDSSPPPGSPDSTTSTTSNPFSDRHEISPPPSPNPFSDFYAVSDNGSAMSLDNLDWQAQNLDNLGDGLATTSTNLGSHQATAEAYGAFGSMIASPLNTTISQGADTTKAAADAAANAAQKVRDSAETMRTTDSAITDDLNSIGQDNDVYQGPPGSSGGRPEGGDHRPGDTDGRPTDGQGDTVPPPPDVPGDGPMSPPPNATPMPNPDPRPIGDRIGDIRQQLGVNNDVGAVVVPTGNRPDGRPYTLDTPVMDLPPENRHGLTPEQQGMTLGEMMGYPPDLMADPDFAGTPAKDALDMQGGGAYNGDSNLLMLDDQHNDNATLMHEVGHARQNEHGFNNHNAQNTLLEYQNVLINENAHHDANGNPPRLSYQPPSGQPQTDWNGLRDYIQGNTVTVGGQQLTMNPAQRDQSLVLFNQIEQLTGPGGPYAGNGAQVRDNLIKEFFAKEKQLQG